MFPTKNKTINRWAGLLSLIFLAVFVCIWGRFVYLAQAKTVSGHDLLSFGEKQWTTVKLVDAQRGKIVGRDGAILAHDVPAYTVYAVLSNKAPSYVKDKPKTAQELAPILKTDELKLLNYLNSKNYQVQFGTSGTKISYDQMMTIKNLHLPGIGFIATSKREYPNGAFASYILGFTTQDPKNDQQKGAFGIEQSLNAYLSEKDGSIKFYSDSRGNLMPDSHQAIQKPKNGDTVSLTIDNNIQSVLEDAMTKVETDYSPQKMIAIAADPKTGAILAMSTRPTFNPNTRDIQSYLNSAISYPFEPGSVMKTFTLAAAINEGVWDGSATYPSGHYKVDNVTIHDWRQDWGTITYQQGLERSSNVAFSRIVDQQLGPDNFFKYLKAFGFTQKTGIDLPNEQNSQINFNTRVDQVMTGFGQGSAVTAIQIVQAATAIANNGTMMKPYLIKSIVDPDTNKVIKKTQPTVVGHPITADTATKVRDLLRGVVDPNVKDGTGHLYNLKDYEVVGKTGTAQIAENGHYLTGMNNYVFSFLGMAPKDDPKLIVYVAIDRPNLRQVDGYSGSVPLSKIFNPVMKTGLQYMAVSPKNGPSSDTKQSEPVVQMEQWVGKSMDVAKQSLEKQGLQVVLIGQGKVQAQSLTKGMSVFKGSQVILLGDAPLNLPDLSNWSLNEVLSLCQLLNLQPVINGNGYVVNQSIQPGTVIHAGDTLKVTLRSPLSSAPTTKNVKQTSTGAATN